MNFEIKDLTGLGQPLTKLLDVIQASCGKLYEPTYIRRIAKAQADGLKLIEAAKAEAIIETGKLIEGAEPALLLSSPGVSPEIVQRAQTRLAHAEVLQQKNIDQVVAYAAVSLPESVSDEPVNQDWATRFFSVAAEVSDADMQSLWGKILAGETAKPGQYSVRTLEVLRNLSRREAEAFRRACTLSMGRGNRVILRVPDESPNTLFGSDSNALSKCGLPYADRIVLAEAGLLAATDDSAITPDLSKPFRLSYQGKRIVFTLIEGSPNIEAIRSGLAVIAFTTAGNELCSLIDDDFQQEYISLLHDRFKPYGLELSVMD